MTACFVCAEDLRATETRGDQHFYDCPRCGPYSLTGSAVAVIPNLLRHEESSRAVLSHAIHRASSKTPYVLLSSEAIKTILQSNSMLPPQEQFDSLMLWLAGKQQSPGKVIDEVSLDAASASCASDMVDVYFLVSQAKEMGLLDAVISKYFGGGLQAAYIQLTLKGWAYVADLQRRSPTATQAFMAMKFGDPELDAIFRDFFKPAIAATGYALKRLDEEPRAGLIDDRLRVEIRQSKFLIADLSHANAGAYWEAGFAEGLGMPVIYTCRKNVFDDPAQRPHFDTNHHLTVVWDPANIGEAVEMLKATIRATLPEDAKMTDEVVQ